MGSLFTVGHSNHTYERLLELLNQHAVVTVCDVRSHPYSRYAEWFNRETLHNTLAADGIRYTYWGDGLGGRSKDKSLLDGERVDYQRVAQSGAFGTVLAKLQASLNDSTATALLCSEKDPARCHRALLIGRVLKGRQLEVCHILANGELEAQSQLEQRLLREQAQQLAQPVLFEQRLGAVATETTLAQAYRYQEYEVAYQSG